VPAVTTTTAVGERSWWPVAVLLFAVGWGANHFAALLAVYKQHLALDAAAPMILFGVYALGLMPGLLLAGPLSDRRGRRAVVMPAAIAALVASGLLGAGGDHFAALAAGRFLYGLAAGAVTSPGSVWLFELSQRAAPGVGARRAAIALSSGFGLGPLVSGVLAQFAPHPMALPYLVHTAVLALAIARASRVPDVVVPAAARGDDRLLRFDLDAAAWRRFGRGVAPMAPWVFAFPSIAFAALPAALGGALGPAPIAYTGLLCALTLGGGVLAQPVTRALEATAAARLGLVAGALGLLLGAAAVALPLPALLLAVAPVLGAAYGICLTAGLRGVQAIAPAHARGGLTGLYYVLTYLGFAAPYLFALASSFGASPLLSVVASAAIAALTAALLRPPRPAR
jgi:MFS family permease